MKASHKKNVFQKLLWFSIYIYIYIYIFLFTRMKELVWTRTNWIWLNAKSLRINMFQTNTEKWVNFSVTVSSCIDVYRNARLRTSTNLYIISLAISDIINAVIVMPFIGGVLITGKWPFGEAVCDFHAFLYRWATHHSHEDSSLYYCRLFFRSCSTRSCISFLLISRENKTSQSKHGFDGPRRGQGKSIDCQRDQAYQIARHCCVCLCTVLDSILDHCDDTALRFWCCRST